MYPTGDSDQTQTCTLTITIPVVNDGIANDIVLDAIMGQLSQLTYGHLWDSEGYAITREQAAAYAQSAYASITVTFP